MFEDKDFFDFDNDIITPTKEFDKNRHLNESSKVIMNKRKLDDSNTLLQTPRRLSNSNTSFSPGFVKRRFPGPAGLLSDTSKRNIDLQHTSNKNSEENMDILLCSQQTYSLFEEGPWEKMTEDFRDSGKEQLYEKFNINWIKVNSSKNKILMNHKAPFLAAILDSLEVIRGQTPTINVTLKDKTGKINSTVLYSLFEEYSDFMTMNSVLVLKQFGVLSLQNNHCITITPNNLASIYHIEKSKPSVKGMQETVKKIVVQPCNTEEIWENYIRAVTAFEKHNSISYFPENRVNDPKFMHLPTPKILNNSSKPNVSSFKRDDSCIYLNSSSSVSPNNISTEITVGTPLQIICGDGENIDKKEKEFSVSCSQVSVKVDKEEHSEIWKNLFEDVNPISLLDDF